MDGPCDRRDRDCGGELRAVANQLTGVVQLCGAGSAFAALRQVAGAFLFSWGSAIFEQKYMGRVFFGGVFSKYFARYIYVHVCICSYMYTVYVNVFRNMYVYIHQKQIKTNTRLTWMQSDWIANTSGPN